MSAVSRTLSPVFSAGARLGSVTHPLYHAMYRGFGALMTRFADNSKIDYQDPWVYRVLSDEEQEQYKIGVMAGILRTFPLILIVGVTSTVDLLMTFRIMPGMWVVVIPYSVFLALMALGSWAPINNLNVISEGVGSP